jgi:Domain of unknown function (DUF4153)
MNASHAIASAAAPASRNPTQIFELWTWTVLVALLGSWTCFAELPGVNWLMWTVCAVAGFMVEGRRSDLFRMSLLGPAALIVACLLSGAAAVTANPHSDLLIFLSVALLCAFAVRARTRSAEDLGPFALACLPFVVCRVLVLEAGSRVAETLAILRMRDALPIVRAFVLAIALATVLFLLLSAADPTLSYWRDAAWGTLLSWTFLARDVFFIVLGTLLLGAYGLAARTSQTERGSAGAASKTATTAATGVRFSDLERLIVTAAAMVLFSLFFAVELWNRFSSGGVPLMKGETLSEATHRGFGEMIVAAALCAIVIITLDQRALRGRRERLVKLLSWGVIAASLFIVASAYERVRYYEAAYGYTEQRLYVQICCGAVAMAMLLLAWELHSDINLPRLTRHVVLVVIACVGGVSYWNSAAWIVQANVGRYERAGKLDVSYLGRLARFMPDAVPALVTNLPRLAPSDAERLRGILDRADLRDGILVPRVRSGDLSWYEWSLRRMAARSALGEAGQHDKTALP